MDLAKHKEHAMDHDEKQLELSISDMSYGGLGISRHNGKVFFTDQCFPGDVVTAQIIEDKETFAKTKRHKLITPSKHRVLSPCKYSEDCGGCQWLEANYSEQVSWKQSFIADSLNRIAKIEQKTIDNIQMISASNQLHYRNRIQLRATINSKKELGLGFFKKNSRTQIHVDECKIAHKTLSEFVSFLSNKKIDCAEQKLRIELQTLPHFAKINQPHLLVTLHPVSKQKGGLKKLNEFIKAQPSVLWSGFNTDLQNPPIFNFNEYKGIKYFTSPSQFQQINLELNNRLRELILAEVEKIESINFVLDLFCGSGNLSMMLAQEGRSVVGVEFSKQAIKIAKFAAKQNMLSNISYVCADSAKFLKKTSFPKIDLLIVDPPRAGMKGCLETIISLRPKYIFYISCDPTTLARDLKTLKEDYEINRIFGLDFFPQTYHVESFVVLRAKEK